MPSMELINTYAESWGIPRIVLVFLIAVVAHVLARCIALGSLWLSGRIAGKNLAKVRTVISLLSGCAVFAIYFMATGYILAEFGISLTAYLATASVIGLAIGFGSQSVVQDVVVGITVILSDLVDVGEMVEISGQVGIVRHVGMRFTMLQNAMGATVYVPNRTLTNIINYPRGYIRCLVDITMPPSEELAFEMEQQVPVVVEGFTEQFPGILRAPVEIEPRRYTASGKAFQRIKFRIWPNRGGPIESTLRQDLAAALVEIDPEFKESRITVNYEVDAQPIRR